MSEESATNPAGGEESAQANLPDAQEVDTEGQQAADEQQFDEDGNPIEPDDSEEVEHDGQKYKVPKAIKPLLLMQADYTRKTQAVAEERAAIQAERQSMHQISQAEFQVAAHAQALGQQIAQYQRIDWPAWHDADPFAAAKASSEYNMVRDQQQAALGQLNQLRQQRQSQAQQETAKRIDQGRQTLTTEIPGWNDDLKAKLIGFAAGYGFSRAELDDLEADPRVARVLHAAFQGSQKTATAQKVQNIVAAQAVTPAAKPGAARAPVQGLDDRLNPDEWVRRRNAQLRKNAGR
jgi:hypothetical protein